jgi:prevent-host-death family protein
MKEISAAAFKAQCLSLMEDVRSTRRPLVITKRGKPVAKLVPIDGVFEVVGDLDADPPEEWESAF